MQIARTYTDEGRKIAAHKPAILRKLQAGQLKRNQVVRSALGELSQTHNWQDFE
jgi:hypothetical protein